MPSEPANIPMPKNRIKAGTPILDEVFPAKMAKNSSKEKIRSALWKVMTIVRMKGLEPLSLSAPDPKSGAATNYATSAGLLYFCGTKCSSQRYKK